MLDGHFRFEKLKEWRKIGDGKSDISEGVLAIDYCKPITKFVLGQSRSLYHLKKMIMMAKDTYMIFVSIIFQQCASLVLKLIVNTLKFQMNFFMIS